ncbi:MAG: (Fe-S)-binding protein [Promethearchaeota archaeon]
MEAESSNKNSKRAVLKRLEEMRERVYSCVGVGDCIAALKGKYSAPIAEAVCPFTKHGSLFEIYFARGKFSIARALLTGKIEPSEGLAEVLYQCTLCGACHEVCNNCEHPDWSVPARESIGDHVEIWEAMRADLVDAGVAPLPRHREIIEYLKKEHNPYNEKHEDRTKWLQRSSSMDKKGSLSGVSQKSEIMFFVGCTGAYRTTDTVKSLIAIADKINVPLFISPDEWCCGSISLRTGTLKIAQELASHNAELFKKNGIKTIVTACAGCYRTLKIDYPKLLENWDFEVLSAIELVNKWIKEGKLKINNENKINEKITYHDPCHLGRHARVFEPPREVIKSIISNSGNLVEMRRNKAYALCCGAGGGVKSAFPELAVEIAQDRIKEAEETGAQYLATACPFCLTNLKDAAKSLGSKLKLVDVLELIKNII